MIEEDKNIAPTLIRLAWHSSGTYSIHSHSHGSCGGTIRYKTELNHGANAGLAQVIDKLNNIYNKHKNEISFADLITLSAVVAIREMNGPVIEWRYGRKDKQEVDTPPEGRLPNADLGGHRKTNDHLRDVFGKMGFDDREIVVLAGAHGMGRCHSNASGYEGPWTPTPTTFNNS